MPPHDPALEPLTATVTEIAVLYRPCDVAVVAHTQAAHAGGGDDGLDGLGIGDGGERFDVGPDHLGCVDTLLLRLGEHDRDRLAEVYGEIDVLVFGADRLDDIGDEAPWPDSEEPFWVRMSNAANLVGQSLFGQWIALDPQGPFWLGGQSFSLTASRKILIW